MCADRDFKNTIFNKENILARSTTKKTDETDLSTLAPTHLSKDSAAWFNRTVEVAGMAPRKRNLKKGASTLDSDLRLG